MHLVRRAPAWLALAGLVVALHAAPVRAAPPAAEPEGLGNLFKYGACALSVAAFHDPLGLTGAFFTCARLLLDELHRNP